MNSRRNRGITTLIYIVSGMLLILMVISITGWIKEAFIILSVVSIIVIFIRFAVRSNGYGGGGGGE